MKLLYVILWFLILQCELIVTNEIIDPVCNCHPCQESKTSAARANQTADPSQSTLLDKEDSDGDGSLVICARDRDRGDRTFPNVCQMRCYNRCSKFGIVVVKKNNTRKYVASVRRANPDIGFTLRGLICVSVRKWMAPQSTTDFDVQRYFPFDYYKLKDGPC